MKKAISLFIALTMVILMMSGVSVQTFAATAVEYQSPIYVDSSDPSKGIKGWETKTITKYTTVTDNTAVWGDGWYVVKGNVDINEWVDCIGHVKLILTDRCSLSVTAKNNNRAGIHVSSDKSSLTIYGQSTNEYDMGKLEVVALEDGAGIGGHDEQNGHDITFNGGYVIARGGGYAAGIGGGDNGSGHNIFINGGIIEAYGGGGDDTDDGGAGIGGGSDGRGHNIVINGGTVKAYGIDGGAGIGGGEEAAGENITINGGNIESQGYYHIRKGYWGYDDKAGAGIGGGESAEGRNIRINGGYVNAKGISGSAGIGGGTNADGHSITITGGEVIATAVDLYNEDNIGGAGIGGGNKQDGYDITITGGDVYAKSEMLGAGIGGGRQGYGNRIKITGGTVTARGGYDEVNDGGAGIGGGWNSDANYITISGGTVTAVGGGGAAGIGGGDDSPGTHITISGGVVNAYGGDDGGAGIGGGEDGNGTDIYITGGIVTAKGNASNTGGNKSDGGAGIGSGWRKYAGEIHITGGTVIATGGGGASGVGCGKNGSLGKVYLGTSLAACNRKNPDSDFVYGRGSKAMDNSFFKSHNDIEIIQNVAVKYMVMNQDTQAFECVKTSYVRYGKTFTEELLEVPEGKCGYWCYFDSLNKEDTVNVGDYVDGVKGDLAEETSEMKIYFRELKPNANYVTLTYHGIDGKLHYKDFAKGSFLNRTYLEKPEESCIGWYYDRNFERPVKTLDFIIKDTEFFLKENADQQKYDSGPKYLVPVYTDGSDSEWETKTVSEFKTVSSSDTEWTDGWYISDHIMIDHTVTCKGDVHLILKDGYTLTINGKNGAGISVTGDSRLTIYYQTERTGRLIANGSENCAGIGGNNGQNGENITINGGDITATGGKNASGIGGGNSGFGRNIYIHGGNVNAIGGDKGAGIGGGYGAIASNISVYGGNVTATGGNTAAGIGGGYDYLFGRTVSNINICGGVLVVNSTIKSGDQCGAAGIGGGCNQHADNITISGGHITATAGEFSAGIGGGCNGNGTNINITEGVVIAYGGFKGAGIGGGVDGIAADITISEGYVHATGGRYGAGIGGGYSNNKEKTVYNITISGGTVKAESTINSDDKCGAAGIGGGCNEHAFNITISGGYVEAKAGQYSAGIGGGCNGDGTYINISGGSVYATGGHKGAGIGGGVDGIAADITISEGYVDATGGRYGAGIGGGYSTDKNKTVKNITVSGGRVYAESPIYSDDQCGAAGIGGGCNEHAEYITISGGEVNATAGKYSAGIGGGCNGKATDIKISGGTVNATGGYKGSGIGSGYKAKCDKIYLSGGDITATGGENGSGIGCGTNGSIGFIFMTTNLTVTDQDNTESVTGKGLTKPMDTTFFKSHRYVLVTINGSNTGSVFSGTQIWFVLGGTFILLALVAATVVIKKKKTRV